MDKGVQIPQSHVIAQQNLRVLTLVLGYVLALSGSLLVFTIPFYASFILLVSGCLVVALSDRHPLPMTRNSWIVLIVGCAVIFVGLSLFGEERIRQWRPFPAGYIPAWFVCFHAFRHIRHFVLRVQKREDAVA